MTLLLAMASTMGSMFISKHPLTKARSLQGCSQSEPNQNGMFQILQLSRHIIDANGLMA